MTSFEFVLDSSAILCLIEDETGADRVEEVLRKSSVLVPAIALVEVGYVSRQERGESEAERRHALILSLPASIQWELLDADVLLAARLKSLQRVSLADALIAATAIVRRAKLLHKDPDFDLFAPELDQESLPYKTTSRGE